MARNGEYLPSSPLDIVKSRVIDYCVANGLTIPSPELLPTRYSNGRGGAILNSNFEINRDVVPAFAHLFAQFDVWTTAESEHDLHGKDVDRNGFRWLWLDGVPLGDTRLEDIRSIFRLKEDINIRVSTAFSEKVVEYPVDEGVAIKFYEENDEEDAFSGIGHRLLGTTVSITVEPGLEFTPTAEELRSRSELGNLLVKFGKS